MWTRQRRRSPDGVCRRARAPRPTIALLIACLVGLAVPAAAQTGVDVDLGAIDGLSPPSAKSSGAIKLKKPGAPPASTAPSPAPAKPAPSASTAPASTPPAPDSPTTDSSARDSSTPDSSTPDSSSGAGSAIVLKPPTPPQPAPSQPVGPTLTPPPQQAVKVPPKPDLPAPRVGANAQPTPEPASPPRNASLGLDGPVAARILFPADVVALPDDAKAELSRLAKRLSGDSHLYAQIVAYAAGESDASEARRVSLSRALAARTYLVDQGVEVKQVDVRPQGNRSDPTLPPDRIDVLVARR